jgi:hypothetical protein
MKSGKCVYCKSEDKNLYIDSVCSNGEIIVMLERGMYKRVQKEDIEPERADKPKVKPF